MHHHRASGVDRNGAQPPTLYLMSAPDRFVVIGNPVAHSLSPVIHAQFAHACGIALEYTTLLAPIEDFRGSARRFFDSGGRGANVTLPFKLEALSLADSASERAQLAGAANVLAARDGRIGADNTDGAGLVADLGANLGFHAKGARIAVLGAGGAARGVLAPLLALSPAVLVIANRTEARAVELAQRFASLGRVRAGRLEALEGVPFDLVVNATSASTHGAPLEIPHGALAPDAIVYDMAYGPAARPFLARAEAQGARVADGLGMLVEQAAEAFLCWHGVRPATAGVLSRLRARQG